MATEVASNCAQVGRQTTRSKTSSTIGHSEKAAPTLTDRRAEFRKVAEDARDPDSPASRAGLNTPLRQFYLTTSGDPWSAARLQKVGVRRGSASSTSHVGEILQGARQIADLPMFAWDPRLPPRAARFLIDLPCDGLWSSARVSISPGTGRIDTDPVGMRKASEAAQLLLEILDLRDSADVTIRLRTNIRPGRGLGSSSADVRGALIALARALRVRLADELLDYLTVVAERATNPFNRGPALFWHRLGLTGMRLPKWPAITVLAFDDASARDVLTSVFPPADYDASQIARFELLAQAAMAAIRRQDSRALGLVASRSVEINDEFLRRTGGSSVRELSKIRDATGAIGYAASHSGTAGALLFATECLDAGRRISRAVKMLRERGCESIVPPYPLDSGGYR